MTAGKWLRDIAFQARKVHHWRNLAVGMTRGENEELEWPICPGRAPDEALRDDQDVAAQRVPSARVPATLPFLTNFAAPTSAAFPFDR